MLAKGGQDETIYICRAVVKETVSPPHTCATAKLASYENAHPCAVTTDREVNICLQNTLLDSDSESGEARRSGNGRDAAVARC